MKKIMSLFMILGIVLTMLPVSAMEEWSEPDYDFTITVNNILYAIEGEQAILLWCSPKKSGAVTIPETIKIPGTSTSVPVTRIGDDDYRVGDVMTTAFTECEGITSVKIPETVTYISPSAFYGCTKLASVNIPSGVKTIEDSTFMYCSVLQSVTLPEGVTSIGNEAFYLCEKLSSINIPNSVKKIGRSAFSYTNLSSITIPDSVEKIGYYILEGTPYGIAEAMANKSQGSCVYAGKHLINGGDIANFAIKEGTLTIADRSFQGNDKLKSVSIPSSVRYIGDYAFQNCTGLTSVSIPSSVNCIGMWGFYGCSALSTITIGNYPMEIQSAVFNGTAFYNNEANWTNNVLYIGNHLIKAKTSLSGAYEVKAGTKSIAGGAFSDCTGLTNVTIPNGITYLAAFDGCTKLSSIEIPNTVTKIGNAAFDYCSSLKDIEIPESVTEIEEGAFSGCKGLTKIVIPDTVKTMGTGVFGSCTGLVEAEIGEGIETIGSSVFESCRNLSKITIGKNIKYAGWRAFSDCESLTEIYYNDTVDKWINIIFCPGNNSINSATIYYKTKEVPTASHPSGIVSFGTKVSLSSAAIQPTIYYTTDGTEPTLNSQIYGNPIPIKGEMTIKAISIGAYDGFPSDIATFNYAVREIEISGSSSSGSGERTITISPKNVESGVEIIVAEYNSGEFSSAKAYTYEGNELPVKTSAQKIRVFIWRDMKSIMPLMPAEEL